jgi:hypothetical protein
MVFLPDLDALGIMLLSRTKGGSTMENMDLGTLIVAGICGIGLIQLVMWIVVMIRHPGFDDLRLDLVKAAPSPSSEVGGTSGISETQSGRLEQ